jgi:nitroimidazol reductase NimA-like FMN-containing flavoprotein (pyridoxamine 5'-phosphate oxidase superfamily)
MDSTSFEKTKDMFGKLRNEEIEELIRNQFIGRIGCHANDLTYVVPVSYAYDGTYIYGRTFEGMKMAMIRKNPRVCFEVDNTKNLANWQSVVAWGELEEIKEKEQRVVALQKLQDRVLPIISSETMHITPQWPFAPDDINNVDGIVYRIRLTDKTGRFEKSVEEFFFAS